MHLKLYLVKTRSFVGRDPQRSAVEHFDTALLHTKQVTMFGKVITKHDGE